MAAIVTDGYTYPARGNVPAQGRHFERVRDTSEEDTELVVTTEVGSFRRLTKVVVKLSAAVSLDVVVSVVSGAGTAFDHAIETLTLTSDSEACYRPSRETLINADDTFLVTVPAAGPGVVARVLLETEIL